MKFWKSLNNLIDETLPEWRDKFLSYKDLKKQLKEIYVCSRGGEIEGGGGENVAVRVNKRRRLDCNDDDEVKEEVVGFVKVLEEEVDKFNAFFVDKEEEYVIRFKVLQDKVAEAKDSTEELMKVGRDLVDFHGEMVLLENYSSLNYTGIVKILKKYDKLSGDLIRLPFIQKVLQEPFFKTDILNKLVKECETLLEQLFFVNQPLFRNADGGGSHPSKSTSSERKEISFKVPDELSEIENMESTYVKLTLSALRVLKEIRGGSSTVSALSLPPLPQSKEVEEVWKKSPVSEEVAK